MSVNSQFRFSMLYSLALYLTAVAVLILTASPASAHSVPPAGTERGASAYPFDMSQVSLSNGRFMENQNRTLTYLKWVDMERLLYNFRATHKLSTKDATPNGGWDAPTWRFRGHVQGHFLTAWSHCYAVLGDDTCRQRAVYFVAELAKCQANNEAAGLRAGYLAGFPESDFDDLEKGNGTMKSGNVPYYVLHKTLAGLLDVWKHIGDTTARDVLLSLSQWVDVRTSKLSYSQMQGVMRREFGGMNAVMIDLYYKTGDKRWISVAQRFDHAAVFDPLAVNDDKLNGLHANTQIPKWIGAAREYKATGDTKYRDIASNAWNITVGAHTYAIGGNSQGEHFHAPNAISKYLARDTAEGCNTYNMLKLTRELWTLDADAGSSTYFDYYERALLNHLLGQQDAQDSHGHVTYHTPLKPGSRRGFGPGGELRYTDDYNSFWCCQGTGLETNTKLMDSIYFRDDKSSALYVNLFTPSVLKWVQRNLTITQTTGFPVSDTTVLKVSGSRGPWTMRIRIPAWTSGAQIKINGQTVQGVSATPGSYASIARSWSDDDEVQVQLPMRLWTMPANDRADLAALFYGPVILAGNYGASTLASSPTLDLSSVRRLSTSDLAFAATAGGQKVDLGPFYDAHGFNYNVYWVTSGELPTTRYFGELI